ncbi:MAG TPA: transferase [Desulfobulbaceae bacterium]|nr:transferase [Desulfobulbaceae bacterium]
MKKTHDSITGHGSLAGKYQDTIVGRGSLWALLYFEWCMWLAPIPGALGLLLRRIFWPKMFGGCGKGCAFGKNITVRHPGDIILGSKVVISENCLLDGRGEPGRAITIGDNVMLANNVNIAAKSGGTVFIGNDVGINTDTIIQSVIGSPIAIGDDCILGQRCLLIAGGSYHTDAPDIPIRLQGNKADSGVRLENNVWLGAGVSVLGGVTMKSGSIAGTGAVVTRDIAKNAICLGVPAKIARYRTDMPL